jgi:hypothetical protein
VYGLSQRTSNFRARLNRYDIHRLFSLTLPSRRRNIKINKHSANRLDIALIITKVEENPVSEIKENKTVRLQRKIHLNCALHWILSLIVLISLDAVKTCLTVILFSWTLSVEFLKPRRANLLRFQLFLNSGGPGIRPTATAFPMLPAVTRPEFAFSVAANGTTLSDFNLCFWHLYLAPASRRLWNPPVSQIQCPIT